MLVETFTLHAECMKTKLGARVSEYKHVLHPKLVDVLTHPTTGEFNVKAALDAAVRRGRTQEELLDHGLSDGEARVSWWAVKKAALEFVEPPRGVRHDPAGGVVAPARPRETRTSMLSKEVYRILREHLAPWCKANGFRRAKEALAWIRPLGERNLLFWFQCTQSGWEAYAGSQFTMEFQLAKSQASGAFGEGRRQRFPGLLNDVQLEAVREIQNRVIAKLVLPPPDYFMFTMKSGSVDVAKWYRARFDPVLHPYAHNEDVWLRYHDDEDVVWWAAFILDRLPACVTKMESLAT